MICPKCGFNTPTTIVCASCKSYMHSKLDEFLGMFEKKKRQGLFYLTIGAADVEQKTITLEHSATIKIDNNHEYLEVTTNIDGTATTTKMYVNDSSISRSDTLVLAEDEGKIIVTQSPANCYLNGSPINGSHPELTGGDILSLSDFTYLKYDEDIKGPAAFRGTLSLVPEGYDPKEYGLRYDNKLFFDGIHKDLYGCLGITVRDLPDKSCKYINRSILGMDYRAVMGGVK